MIKKLFLIAGLLMGLTMSHAYSQTLGPANLRVPTSGWIEFDGGTLNTFTCTSGHCSIEGATLWDSGNDGAGSTLDADLLDGLSSSAFQPIDADLTSWASITRASGFDTWVTTPSTANLSSLLSDEASGWTNWQTTPTSANLRTYMTDEIGSSVLVFLGTPGDDQVPVGDSSSATTWRTIPDSDGATQKLQYDQATNSFSAGTDDDVPEVGDFGALVGGSGIDNNSGTLDLDLTEITSMTWGANNFTTETFSTDGVDLTWDYTTTDAAAVLSGGGTSPILGLDDQGTLRFYEEDTNGSNFIAFATPASITSDRTCTLTDAAAPIPDSCVGNGVDDTGGGGYDPTAQTTVTWGTSNFGDMIFSGAGAIDITFNFATSNTFVITQTDAGAAGPIIQTYHNSASPAANDIIAKWDIAGEDSAGNTQTYGQITTTIDDATSTSEDATLRLGVVTAGTVANEVRLTGAAFSPEANDGNALGTSSLAWSDLFLATGGLIEFDGGTTNTLTCTGGNCTIEGNGLYRAGGTDVAVADGGTGASSLTDLITLGTHTTGSYVQQVADGTGIDGTANAEGATYTPTLDLTEINSATWGSGTFTTFTFDAGATDPTMTFGSGTLLVEAVTSFRQADAANAGGQIKLLEDPGTGSNFISFLAPASITSDVTCTLENDSSPIPDSCVGDGVDGGGGSQTPWTSDIDAGGFNLLFDDDTGVNSANDTRRVVIGDTSTDNIDGWSDVVLLDVTGGSFPALGLYAAADGQFGPTFYSYQNTASPAVNDVPFEFWVYSRDSATNIQNIAQIKVNYDDVTSGTEDASWGFYAIANGTIQDEFYIGNGALLAGASVFPGKGNLGFATGKGLFDGNGNEEVLFTATGSAVNYLNVINSATGVHPAINAAGDDADIGLIFTAKGSPQTGVTYNLGAADFPFAQFTGTSTGAGGPLFRILHNSSSPAANDELGELIFAGNDSALNTISFATIDGFQLDPTDGSEDGSLNLWTRVAGSGAYRMRVGDGVIIGSGTTYPGAGNIQAAGLLLTGTSFLSTYQGLGGTGNGYTPVMQLNATSLGGSSTGWSRFTNSATTGVSNVLAKSRGATVGDYTATQSGDRIGGYYFDASDGTDFETAAAILGYVDGTPGHGTPADMPGRLEFMTTADGADDPTTRMTIKNDGDVLIGSNTSSVTQYGITPGLQISSTSFSGASAALAHFSADADPANLIFSKSRGTSVGAFDAVSSGDVIADIVFMAADGTDLESVGASIRAQIDGTPGANDVPTKLIFSTTIDGQAFPGPRMTIWNSGGISMGDTLDSDPGTGNVAIDDAGEMRWYETEANGDSYVAFIAAPSLAANRTCTFQDSGPPIPDSCVGDGVDDGAGGGITEIVQDTTPQLGGDLDANTFDILFDDATGIRDESDNEQLIFQTTASAVNYFEITNNATNNAPILSVNGSDTHVGMQFNVKGDPAYAFTFNMGDASSDGFSEMRFQNVNNGAWGPGVIWFQDSASPAANDAIGYFQFNGRDSGANNQAYSYIQATILDPTDTSEDSMIEFQNRVGGAFATSMKLGYGVSIGSVTPATWPGTGYLAFGSGFGIKDKAGGEELLFTQTASAVNELTIANAATGNRPIISATGDDTDIGMEFRVKGGPSLPFRFDVGTNNGNAISELYSNVDSAFGPIWRFRHDDPSPDAGDSMQLAFQFEDDTSAATNMAFIEAFLDDPTNTSEDGRLAFRTRTAGSLGYQLHIAGGVSVGNTVDSFPGTGNLAIDDSGEFRLYETEANGDNYFALIAPDSLSGDVTCTIDSNGRIPDSCVGDGVDGGGGGGLSDGDYGDVTVSGTGTAIDIDPDATITATTGGADDVKVTYQQSGGTQAANDWIGHIYALGQDDASNINFYADYGARVVDATNGSEDGAIVFNAQVNGTGAQQMAIGNGVIIGSGTTYPGAGALQVESEKAVFGHNTTVGFGGFNAAYSFYNTDPNAVWTMGQGAYQNNAIGVEWLTVKSRGTTEGSNAVLQNNDGLWSLTAYMSDSDSENIAARIGMAVDGTPESAGDTSDSPSRIFFATVPDGSGTLTTRLTIKNDGGVIIGDGSTSPGAENLSVEGGSIELGNAGTAATDTTIARSAAGEATLEGDAIKHAGKQVMWIPAGAMKASALNPASCGDTYDSGSNDVTIVVCAFDTGATEENAEFGVAMPKSWNEGTITAQVAWTNAGGASTETVQWKIACTGFGDDDALNTAYPADVTISDTWTAQNDYTLTAETSAITVQNAAEGDFVTCRIGRDTSVDNMAGDALLIGIKLYWTDNASTLAE